MCKHLEEIHYALIITVSFNHQIIAVSLNHQNNRCEYYKHVHIRVWVVGLG